MYTRKTLIEDESGFMNVHFIVVLLTLDLLSIFYAVKVATFLKLVTTDSDSF